MSEVRLKRLFESVSGGSWGTEPEDGEVTLPCIRGTDFDYRILRSDTRMAPIRGFSRHEIAQRAARRGDLIIEKSGGGEKQPVGRVVLHDSADLVMPTNFASRLTPLEDNDPRFLTYLMSSLYEGGTTKSSIKQTTGIQNLDLQSFLDTVVLRPSLSEQRAIADYLDAETARIDAIIEKKRRLAAKLWERRVSIMLRGVAGQLINTGEMVNSRLPWLTQLPKHWGEPLLKLVAQLGSGHTPNRNRSEWWVDCTIPWITTGEVSQMREDRIEYIAETREKISELGMANSSAELHPKDTVVLSRTASAGFSAIMGTDMATSQDFVTWTCGPMLDPRYLLLCLRAMRHDLLGRLAQGSTHQTIYMPDIESIRIPLPPLNEQREIVDTVWRSLRKIDKIINLQNHQIELLTEHRQALITAAVTGQLEVPDTVAS